MAGTKGAIKRLEHALLATGLMNEKFVDWIREGEVDEAYVEQALQNFQAAMHPAPLEPEVEYVLGFMFDIQSRKILLIWKDRPSWQKGLLNGIGGRVEPGETPHQAMVREFKEETFFDHLVHLPSNTIHLPDWHHVGIQRRKPNVQREPGSYTLHIFACMFNTHSCDFENQRPNHDHKYETVWAVPADYGQVKREEIINLPANTEIIQRHGVPDLNLHIDLAWSSLHLGRTFRLDEPDTLSQDEINERVTIVFKDEEASR